MSRTPTCRYHCVRCDRHFASLLAYDAHIYPVGVHHSPADVPQLNIQTDRARCDLGARRGHSLPLDNVRLWEYKYMRKELMNPMDQEDADE